MTLQRYAVRELRGRSGRSLLTLLGIVIGVSTVVAVWTSAGAARQGFRQMFESVAGHAAFEVVREGGGGLDPALAWRLEELEGVRGAVPSVVAPAALFGEGKTMPIVVVGIDPARQGLLHRLRVREGTLLERPGLVMVPDLVEGLGLRLGAEARLMTSQGIRPLEVVGVLEPTGTAGLLGGNVAFARLADAQALAGLGSQVSTLHLVLEHRADEAAVLRAVEAALPEGVVARRPASRSDLALAAMTGTELGLTNAGALSIVLGLFIILNTFLMNLGERRRQLATLRSVGATRRQVGRMILGEALVFGTAGALVGVPLGLLAAWGASGAMRVILQVPLPPLQVDPAVVGLGLLLGPVVSVLAALGPALLAREVSPLEIARRRDTAPARSWSWLSLLGVVTLLVSALVAAGVVSGRVPVAWSPVATTLGLGSIVLIVPLLLRPLAALVTWVTRPVRGPTAEIALRQLLRQPLRTSLTVGVLATALAMSIGLGNAILTSVDDVRDYVNRTIVGDFIVRSVMPDPLLMVVPSLPEALGDELAAVPGVRQVQPVKFLQVQVDDQRAMLLARRLSSDGEVHLDLDPGVDPAAVRAGLERGEVVLGSRLAQALGKTTGDRVTLRSALGPVQVRIAGTMTEFTGGGMAFYARWETAKQVYGFQGVDVFLIGAEPERRAEVEAALTRLTGERRLLLQSHRSFRDLIEHMTAGVVGSLWSLLAVLFVVASFGVVNTLTMNVLEQTRELGLLRAVAMTRPQVRRTVAAQAGLIALFAFVPGGLLGVGLAWLMNATTPALLGLQQEFQIYGVFTIGTLVIAGAVTVLAGVLPAIRAARLNVVEALKYE